MAPRRKNRRIGQKGKKKAPAAGARQQLRDASTSSYSSSGSSSRPSEEESSSDNGGSDEDDPRDYKRGGYHPVMPYQLYSARYRVLSKLGAGAFSTVWLCADEKEVGLEGPELVAMKVCKSKKSVTEQAVDEVLLLERLQDASSRSAHVVQMRGHFWHTGPNGRHKCVVFEVMGENLLALVKHYDYNGLPPAMVRRLARHTLLGLEYIHSRGVIHTDVKLENVLVQRHDLGELLREARRAHRAFTEQKSGLEALSKSQKKRLKKKQKAKAKGDAAGSDGEQADGPQATNGAQAPAEAELDASAADQAAAEACGRPVPPVRQRERFDTLGLHQVFAKLADFGNGCRVNKKVTDEIQTRQYRSPEVIIGADWDETADVWSAACMFFELLTGDFLFDPRTGEDWTRDEDHLALMVELLGDLPPKEYALSGKYSRDFFNNSGKLKHIKNLKFWSLRDVLTQKYSLTEEEATEFSDFLLPQLHWEPKRRQSATEALKHRWVQLQPGETDEPPSSFSTAEATAGSSSPAREASGLQFSPAPRGSTGPSTEAGAVAAEEPAAAPEEASRQCSDQGLAEEAAAGTAQGPDEPEPARAPAPREASPEPSSHEQEAGPEEAAGDESRQDSAVPEATSSRPASCAAEEAAAGGSGGEEQAAEATAAGASAAAQ